MVETFALILSAVCIMALTFLVWLTLRQFDRERLEWQKERSKLLDRIQSGGLSEYKAQERAEKPIKHREIDPAKRALEKERWL